MPNFDIESCSLGSPVVRLERLVVRSHSVVGLAFGGVVVRQLDRLTARGSSFLGGLRLAPVVLG